MSASDRVRGARSMAEQLAPIAATARRRYANVRPVSQVILRLHRVGGADRFASAVGTVVSWIDSRAGRPLPKEAWDGTSFELEEVGAQRAEAVALDDPRYWAARIDDADRNIPQRTWVTEVGVGVDGNDDDVLFGTRLICVSRTSDTPFERSIPGFVRQVIEDGHATIDGIPITIKPRVVATNKDVNDFVELLVNPARRCPVVALALPEGSTDIAQTAVSALEIHRRTLGAAHVFTVTSPASFALSDRVGREFSVYRQAVRTYQPRFNPYQDQPFRHPLSFAERIASWEGGGAAAYETFLVGQVLSRSVAFGALEEELPPLTTVRQVAARLQRERVREAGASDRDLLELADREIETLHQESEQQKETYDGLLQVAEEERDQARQAEQEFRQQIYGLRVRIDSLQEQIRAKGAIGADQPIPTGLDDFENWCRTNLAGSVLLHNRAFQGIKKSVYEDPQLIYRALLLLRDAYVPMRREGGIERKRAFEEACGDLQIEESATGEARGENKDQYTVLYAGSPRPLERHLKRGTSHDPRYCFRLYFFWDDEEEQVVVGWLPSHLDNRLT